eukprot:1139694-Pelagomonas_calceolata.AAC.1
MLGSTWSSEVLGKLAIAGGWLAGSRPMMMLTGELDGQMVRGGNYPIMMLPVGARLYMGKLGVRPALDDVDRVQSRAKLLFRGVGRQCCRLSFRERICKHVERAWQHVCLEGVLAESCNGELNGGRWRAEWWQICNCDEHDVWWRPCKWAVLTRKGRASLQLNLARFKRKMEKTMGKECYGCLLHAWMTLQNKMGLYLSCNCCAAI